jgi:hypothetical protein
MALRIAAPNVSMGDWRGTWTSIIERWTLLLGADRPVEPERIG